jgi:copper chaperone CopZ
MRLIAPIALAFVLAACQRADPAEESARKVAEASANAPKPAAAAPIATPAPIEEPVAPSADDHHACGGACGASCNGSCGAGCMAAAGETPPKQDIPKDATWASLTVDGMHCGGCARRIQTRLAQLDGVVGSEVDLGTHTVRVAVKKGIDARAIATPAIDELGYHVR